MKTGYVERYVDVSGVTGTGRVSTFAINDDGRIVIFWPSGHGYFDSLAEAIKVHGHEGKTRFVILTDTEEEHCIICHDSQLNCDHTECPGCIAEVMAGVSNGEVTS